MTTLRTARLILRPPLPGDALAYAAGVGDYEVARFLTPVPHPYTVAMAETWLAAAPISTLERAFFIIDLPSTGLIGSVTLLSELGFWVTRPHWNRGYASEAATALLGWHFDGTQAIDVASGAQFDNAASLKVQAKLGFVETGRQLRFGQTLQREIEHVVTKVTRADFTARRPA